MGLFLPKSQKPKSLHEFKYKILKACVHRYLNISPFFGDYEIKETCIADPVHTAEFKAHRFDIWHVKPETKKKVLSFYVSYDKYDTNEYLSIDKYVDGDWTESIIDGINEEALIS